MARSGKKKKPPTLAKVSLMSTFIENPAWRQDLDGEPAFPRRIKATVNIRESAVATLAARKVIDQAQAAAADRFRRYWETMGGKGASAIDYGREHVDGGKIAEPINVDQLMSGRQLKAAREKLGERNYKLVGKVCGEGLALAELYTEKRERLTAADNLRASLDDLSDLWGIATTASAAPNRKHWSKARLSK